MGNLVPVLTRAENTDFGRKAKAATAGGGKALQLAP